MKLTPTGESNCAVALRRRQEIKTLYNYLVEITDNFEKIIHINADRFYDFNLDGVAIPYYVLERIVNDPLPGILRDEYKRLGEVLREYGIETEDEL